MPRTKFEYTVLAYETNLDGWVQGLATGLDVEGAEGWEAVGVVHQTEGMGYLLLKRPK